MSSTMTAAVLVAPGKVEVREVAVPTAGPGQVRIRLSGCGVCASNLPSWEGRPWFQYPFAPGQLGHEGWGVIDQVDGSVQGLREGDVVAAMSEKAYAQYDVTSADNVVVLPKPLRQRSFPGEPLGCAMNILARSGISPGQTVAVIGIGFLGAVLTRMVTQAGARVIAISRRPYSLEVAARMGASELVPMDDHWKIIERVKELTSQKMCEVVIEAVGKQWPLDLAAELTADRGRLVVAGYHQDGPRQVNMQLWNWRGLDVINAHERDPHMYVQGIRSAVAAVSSGKVDPQSLLTHEYPLSSLAEALQTTAERPGQFMKAFISMKQ